METLITAKRHNLEQWYKCEDCNFMYTVHTNIGRKSFCPKCGESVATVRIERPKLSARATYREWKEEELKVLEKVISKELHVYQAAVILGRSRESVDNKARRVKRSRGI
jgi:transcription initiation factor IIE alpha subunit